MRSWIKNSPQLITCQETNLTRKHNFLLTALVPGPDVEPSAITLLLHLAHFWTRGSCKRVQQPVTGLERGRERERGILAESEYERGRDRRGAGVGSNCMQQTLIDGRDGDDDG